MNRNVIIAIILGVLVLFAAIQAVQLNKITAGVKTIESQPQYGQQQDRGNSVPASTQNLPSMVGGC